MEKLVLKNNWLDTLLKVLGEDLPFTRSRKRKLFLDALTPKIKSREESRMALIEKFGKKDENKKPILVGNQYQIEDVENFNKEIITLFDEDVIVDILPSIKESILVVKEIIENSKMPVSMPETEILEKIIKSFEDLKAKK